MKMISRSSRREVLVGVCAGAALAATPASLQARAVLAVGDMGIPPEGNAAAAIQSALDRLAASGGGVLHIGGRYRAGVLIVRGSDITIEGDGGVLLDTRLVIAPQARRTIVRNLTILETRGSSESFLIDISGRDCEFSGLSLIKRPKAGDYQGYIRSGASGCRFSGLTLDGSNGLFVAGTDHVFERFDFTSTLTAGMGGDDAFALKGAGSETSDIVIRNGTVRGFAAAISLGSEIGSNAEWPGPGAVRRVRVQNVIADRCQSVCFIKPGALIYDWRNGVVEDVFLDTISLTDPRGDMFTRGIAISAARGAQIRRVIARNINIAARAHSQGIMPTAAVDITIRRDLPAATIADVDLQLVYNGEGERGYPVDQIVRVEKDDAKIGTMRNISIDVSGSGSRIAGIYVGPGLDDAVVIPRARLTHVAQNPPATVGAAGIWSDSRIVLGDVQVDAVKAPARGGRR